MNLPSEFLAKDMPRKEIAFDELETAVELQFASRFWRFDAICTGFKAVEPEIHTAFILLDWFRNLSAHENFIHSFNHGRQRGGDGSLDGIGDGGKRRQ